MRKTSLFEDFQDFLQVRASLGYSTEMYKSYLQQFISFCEQTYGRDTEITRQILDEWLLGKEFSSSKTKSNAIGNIRSFTCYQQSIGKQTFIPSPDEYRQPRHPARKAYIFTDHELEIIFNTFDSMEPCKASFHRELINPVLFRMMFCCGMRPAEPLSLKTTDVNLKTGEIIIRQAKGRKDRRIVMSQDLCNLCGKYDSFFPRTREFFFQREDSRPFKTRWMDNQFNICLRDCGLAFRNKPRPYDLRHSFATRTIMRWVDEKKDVMAYLPYLSAYMGHSSIGDTLYYIHLLPGRLKTSDGIDWNLLNHVYEEGGSKL